MARALNASHARCDHETRAPYAGAFDFRSRRGSAVRRCDVRACSNRGANAGAWAAAVTEPASHADSIAVSDAHADAFADSHADAVSADADAEPEAVPYADPVALSIADSDAVTFALSAQARRVEGDYCAVPFPKSVSTAFSTALIASELVVTSASSRL